jgi:hypothetical protein
MSGYHKIPKIIAVFVSLIGVMVIIGWIFDIPILKSSITPAFPFMKFISAICFVMSGIILFFICGFVHPYLKKEYGVVSFIAELIIFLLTFTVLASVFLKRPLGVESMFIKEIPLMAKTVFPGQPSLVSVLNFILIAFIDCLIKLNFCKLKENCFQAVFIFAGGWIGLSGLIALTGYALKNSYLYFYVPGINNAMSIFSAFLFFLIGVVLVMLGTKHKGQNEN